MIITIPICNHSSDQPDFGDAPNRESNFSDAPNQESNIPTSGNILVMLPISPNQESDFGDNPDFWDELMESKN